jgi:hypothetical protein
MNVGPLCGITHTLFGQDASKREARMPSKAVLTSLHLRPLALFGKNFLTLLGLALVEGVGAAHTSRVASDGFALQKRLTVTSCGGVGFTSK